MTSGIVVLNAGSSSLKCSLYAAAERDPALVWRALVDGLGTSSFGTRHAVAAPSTPPATMMATHLRNGRQPSSLAGGQLLRPRRRSLHRVDEGRPDLVVIELAQRSNRRAARRADLLAQHRRVLVRLLEHRRGTVEGLDDEFGRRGLLPYVPEIVAYDPRSIG